MILVSSARRPVIKIMAEAQGRPRKEVDKEELRYLRQTLGYTWKEVSALLGVSSKTLQRRAAEWGICKYTRISDNSLDEEVDDILGQFPNSGEVMINGHLKARNVCFIMPCSIYS